MIKTINLTLTQEVCANDEALQLAIAQHLQINTKQLAGFKLLRRSLDARGKIIKWALQIEAYVDQAIEETAPFTPIWKEVHHAPFNAIVVGAGPAGLFAAIELVTKGIKPIIIERGKEVRARRRDLAAINKLGEVNPESNYCFGEGGAGTYSDGKLYTRSTKRGDVRKVLQYLVHFGADPSILIDAHPHIGTNKLPKIISAIREQLIACGAEVRFDTKLTDIHCKGNVLTGIEVNQEELIPCTHLILATGHSARDIYTLLAKKGIATESKPFALGVRIEHPQSIIDSAQYKCAIKPDWLPPASYSLVTQASGKGAFSFCMCPGGIIAPAATAPGEIVVNGWSPSKRNNPYANSGTVVTVDEQDFARYGFIGPLAGMHYQQMIEQKAFAMGGGLLKAPAQRMIDFTSNIVSTTLPDCSYLPGIVSSSLQDTLPKEITIALKIALKDFGKKMKGYYTNDAVLVATESRTSAPVRIPRDKNTLEHIQIKGLYPCAEGAGYAGGIVSAAIDGMNCAHQIAQKVIV
jgi:uncharacterized FAD-dependent dehydrogenase